VKPLGRVFRKDDQIQAGIATLHAINEACDLMAIGEHLFAVRAHGHLIIHDGYADRIG
jgi:hypothetical protein